MEYMIEKELTKDLMTISKVKETKIGYKIKDYYYKRENYKRVTKEGALSILRENLNFSNECFLELHINKHLSLYYSTVSKQVCNFRIGCFLGRLDECWDLKRGGIEQIFNLIHYKNTKKELKKFLKYIKILKSKIKKTPLKKEWKLKDNIFFIKISNIKDFEC